MTSLKRETRRTRGSFVAGLIALLAAICWVACGPSSPILVPTPTLPPNSLPTLSPTATPLGNKAQITRSYVGDQPSLEPRPTPAKPPTSTILPGYSRERLHLKFQEGTAIRLRGNHFASLDNDDLSGLEAALKKYPDIVIERLFSRSEEELAQEKTRIEAESGRQQADKNLYYRLILRPGTDAEALLNDLNTLPLVESTYAEPLPLLPPSGGVPP